MYATVLSPADDEHHIDKQGKKFKVPFVCGARNLGEALRRIAEGAAMIRTKGEAGTGKCCLRIFYFCHMYVLCNYTRMTSNLILMESI